MWGNTHVILKLCGKCFYLEIFSCIINVTEESYTSREICPEDFCFLVSFPVLGIGYSLEC